MSRKRRSLRRFCSVEARRLDDEQALQIEMYRHRFAIGNRLGRDTVTMIANFTNLAEAVTGKQA